jgi:hypothetical protein
MQTKFKRHQKVKILRIPDPEYIEYKSEDAHIKPNMLGEVNIILPNGQYHVEIFNEKGETVAYAPFSEDDLEAVG